MPKTIASPERLSYSTGCCCARYSCYKKDWCGCYFDDCFGSALEATCCCCSCLGSNYYREPQAICVKYKSTHCCFDVRVAIPTDSEIPCAFDFCGVHICGGSPVFVVEKKMKKSVAEIDKLMMTTSCGCYRCSFYKKDGCGCHPDCCGVAYSNSSLCCEGYQSSIWMCPESAVLKCVSTQLCVDYRCAFPTNDELPCGISCCGFRWEPFVTPKLKLDAALPSPKPGIPLPPIVVRPEKPKPTEPDPRPKILPRSPDPIAPKPQPPISTSTPIVHQPPAPLKPVAETETPCEASPSIPPALASAAAATKEVLEVLGVRELQEQITFFGGDCSGCMGTADLRILLRSLILPHLADEDQSKKFKKRNLQELPDPKQSKKVKAFDEVTR